MRYPILHKLKDRLNQTWYQIRIGDRLAYISALDAQPDNGLPVLTYHHILRDEENTRFRHTSTTTSVRAFNNQMAWLRDRGYATLSMAQLEGYVKNKINLPARAVVITFDDGLKSVSRYAYPVLKQYGMKATAFVVTSRIKRHPQKWNPKSLQFMSVSELNEIRDVLDFQSHTHFLHRVDGYRRPILLSRSEHNILFDFARSRRALAQFNPHENHVLTAAFLCFAWTAFWVLFLLHYFPKVFSILDRQSLLNLMEATKDSPDVKQELLNRLFSGKRMTGRDEMDICRLLRKNEVGVRTTLPGL